MLQRGNEWIGRNAPDLSMRIDNANWKVFDGNGLTYTFTQDPTLLCAQSTCSADLAGTGLWLLSSINGAGGASVVLKYALASVSLPDATEPAVAIDLANVSYNPHPAQDCFKHQVLLLYAIPLDPRAQALSVMGERVLVRDHKLAAVDVTSRASCGEASQVLRRYSFTYTTDPDTKQARLASVKMSGREGTPEANVAVPIAAYGYGAATDSTTLRYRAVQPQILLPPALTQTNANWGIAMSAKDTASLFQSPLATSPNVSVGMQSFLDITGDGRPDVIYTENGKLYVARNMPGPGGSTTLAPPALLNDNTFTRPILDARSSKYDRFGGPKDSLENHEDVWLEAIDVNGDGRVDVIDAAASPNYWTVYLNTPDPGPSGVKWVKRPYYIGDLDSRFVALGLKTQLGYLPLSRRFNGRHYEKYMCWRWDGHQWAEYPSGLQNTDPLKACYHDGDPVPGQEKTYVEWEVRDINGDGYPDVVYNSSPVGFVFDASPPLFGDTGKWERTQQKYEPQLLGQPNRVEAVLNVRGIFIPNDYFGTSSPFSAPVVLLDDSSCGVGQWHGPDQALAPPGQVADNIRDVGCGFADVNGDGLVDRIDEYSTSPYGTYARLGTGSGFQNIPIMLPGKLSAQQSTYVEHCIGVLNWTPFVSTQTAGLRDLTGDGIPDYVQQTQQGFLQVYVGTSAGFNCTRGGTCHTPPVNIDTITGFEISREDEVCDGRWSRTAAGIFDVDGDGRPDRVNLVPAPNNRWALDVAQLAGDNAAGIPEAGRIVSLDNGYGAKTKITYRSAKED